MAFPKVPTIGCLITIPLDPSAAITLVQTLTGVLLHCHPQTPKASGLDATITGEIGWNVVGCEEVAKALGTTVLEYTEAAPGRAIELSHGMRLYTGAVRLHLSRERCELSIATSITYGQQIRDRLSRLT